ncbi:MAG: hypothetical protein ACR2G0_03015 [Chthoniobacterales bacterium]
MSASANNPAESNPPAKDETGLLEVLRLLLETEKARTTADLLKYATQYNAPDAEERLRVLDAEKIPVDLAFDALSVHLRLLAYKKNSALLSGCRGQKAGLILPLPPHVVELFVPVAEVTFLQPAEGGVHGMLHEVSERAVKGARAGRAEAQKMEVLVFEAFRKGAEVFVDTVIADVLEPKMLPPGIKLIAHLRPHRNPQDVIIQLSEVAFI